MRPSCSATMRRWPSDCEAERRSWARAMSAGSRPASSRSASAHASSEVSRVMTWRRMPKRSSRPRAGRGRADALQLLRHLRGRLAPGEVDVDVARGDLDAPPPRSRRGRSPAAPADPRRARPRRGRARRRSRARRSQAPRSTARNSPGLRVALVLVEEVAVAALLGVVAADDDVEEQPPAGDPLVGRGHLRGERRREERGPEGDEELEPLGLLRQRGGQHPGVGAPARDRRQRRLEAGLLGGARDLPEVGEAAGALPVAGVLAGAAADRVAVAEIGARVARRGQEPVEPSGHGREEYHNVH